MIIDTNGLGIVHIPDEAVFQMAPNGGHLDSKAELERVIRVALQTVESGSVAERVAIAKLAAEFIMMMDVRRMM